MQINGTTESQEPAQEVGQSEHDKEMIKVAEGQEQEASQDTNSDGDRPEWLLEKFKTPEDQAKAYIELEKKLGQKQEQQQESEDSGEQDAQVKNNERYESYTKELQENGKLSDETYKELLEKDGITKEQVDQYIEENFKPEQSNQEEAKEERFSEQEVNSFLDFAGGKESFDEVATWARDNADPEVIKAFDTANSTVVLKALYGQIKSAYVEANGIQGTRITDTKAPSSDKNVFNSWDEVTAAMNDPRYHGPQKIDSYVREVEQKIARSNKLM